MSRPDPRPVRTAPSACAVADRVAGARHAAFGRLPLLDVLVVGGGINGAGIARDLAGRG